MTKKEFNKMINKKRLDNKDKWVVVQELVGECLVVVKFYNTWIQLMYINDGAKYSGPMDCSVTEFRKFISDTLDRILE